MSCFGPVIIIMSSVCKIVTVSGSQDWFLREMVFTFMFGVVSRPILSEESDGADHFLKKRCTTCPFGPILDPQVGPNKKPCYLPVKLILKYSKHPVLCLEAYRIQLYKFQKNFGEYFKIQDGHQHIRIWSYFSTTIKFNRTYLNFVNVIVIKYRQRGNYEPNQWY